MAYPTGRKTLYLTPSNQASIESWRARWRQHNALAMSRSFWSKACLRYGQYDVLQDAPFDTGEGFAGIGVGWSMPGNGSGIDAMMSDPEGVRMMLADEQQVFGIYVGDIAVIVEETVLRPRPVVDYTLFLRLYRESADFESRLVALGEALLADPALEPLLDRLSVGRVVPDDYTKNSRFDFEGLLEMSVGTLDAVQALLASPRLREIVEAFSDAIRADWRIIATEENLFWDQTASIDESARLIRDYPPVYHPPVEVA